jgi:hypothetical protein
LLCISFFLCCMFHRSSGRVSAADATLGIIAYYYDHSSFSRFFLLVCEGFSTFAGFWRSLNWAAYLDPFVTGRFRSRVTDWHGWNYS